MKKKMIISLAVLLAVVVSAVVTVAALANNSQQRTVPLQSDLWCDGDDSGFCWQDDPGHPPMISFLIEALAEKTGLSTEEIETRLDSGERLYDIALDAGLSEEDYFEMVDTVRQAYLDQAVEEGWITEERAEWMSEHGHGFWQGGFGGRCGSSDSSQFTPWRFDFFDRDEDDHHHHHGGGRW